MTTTWILAVATCVVVFLYGVHLGKKEEKRRLERRASSRMAFDSKPRGN